MEKALAKLKKQKNKNVAAKRIASRDVQMSLIKEQILDLNDKFDYFILTMLQNGKISLPDKSPMDFFNQDGSAVIQEYQMEAYQKNLGGRMRHREVLTASDGFVGRDTNRYTDSAVKNLVNKLKSEKSLLRQSSLAGIEEELPDN